MAATPDYPLNLGAGYVRPCGGNAEAQRWFNRVSTQSNPPTLIPAGCF